MILILKNNSKNNNKNNKRKIKENKQLKRFKKCLDKKINNNQSKQSYKWISIQIIMNMFKQKYQNHKDQPEIGTMINIYLLNK